MNISKIETHDIVPEKIPNGVHQSHALALNSGFLTREAFQEFFEKSEQIANKMLKEAGFLNPQFYENLSEDQRISRLDQFFTVTKRIKAKIAKDLDDPVAPHGGGTLAEYMVLAKLRGDATSTILMHEPRIGMFLYPGEESLSESNTEDFQNYRGIFPFMALDDIRDQSLDISQQLNIPLQFGIELEDFENFPAGKKFRLENSEQYAKFDYQIHSKHSMLVGEKNIPLDSTPDEFEKVLEQFFDNQIGMVCQYVRDQIDIVIKNGKPGDSLAHSDLIRLPMIKKLVSEKNLSVEEANLEISKIFQHTEVQNIYKELLSVLQTKQMSIGINLSLGGKLKTTGLFYGEEILNLIAHSQVPIMVEKDTHSLSEEQLAPKYWAEISDTIKNFEIPIVRPKA